MKLSVGMLVSNRKNTIRKVCASLKPLLDSGIAEFICADTVSQTPGLVSDGSADIVREFTDKVFPFEWIRDFSAARNAILEKAAGEWFMFVDDDEWFEDVSAIVEFFESGEYMKFKSASWVIRNYSKKDGSEWTDSVAVRLVKRTEKLYFVGSVHETYNELLLPCKELACLAHHFGYAFDSEDEKREHRERNLSLLRVEIEKDPDNLRLCTQMALELANFDNESALSFTEETLSRFEEHHNENYFQWLLALKFPLYEALGRSWQDAERDFGHMLERFTLTDTALLSIHYSLTRLHLLGNDAKGAVPHIREYFEIFEYLEGDRETAVMQNCADFAKYRSEAVVSEMRKFEEYCMTIQNDTIDLKEGMISFGKKQFDLNGTTEEKLAKLNEMSFEDFSECIERLCEESASCFEDPFLSAVIDFFEKENTIEYCCVLYKCAEKEIVRAVGNGADGFAISEILTECILTERKMYELLYRPEVFTEKGLRWLPAEVTYNDILYRFVSGGGKDLKLVLEAAKVRPEMVPVMKAWLGVFK